MLFRLFMWLVGYYEIAFEKGLKAANVHIKGRLSLLSLQKNGRYAVGRCLFFQKRRLLREAKREGLSFHLSPLYGLPAFVFAHKTRIGAIVGIFFGIFLTVLSEHHLWEITVVGNETLRDEEIYWMLREEGIYEGVSTDTIDTLGVANRLAKKSDKLAFVGINIIGNRLEAVVLEHKAPSATDDDTLPSNVVAKTNGVIVAVLPEGGESKLKAGDVVKKGDLLISGVNELRNGKYHYQRAKGQVFAEVLGEKTVTKELFVYEKKYTDAVFEEKEIIFFTFSKKFSKDGGNLPLTCDRIETKDRIMLFGKIPLPLWYRRVTYREFTLAESALSQERAIALCRKEILSSLSDTPLLSYTEEIAFDGERITLTARYRAIEDIAEECPLFTMP